MVKSLSGLHQGDGSLTFTHRPIFKAHLVVAFGKNLCYPLGQNNHSCCDKAISVHLDLI